MSYYRPGGIGTGSATTVPFQISEGGTGATNAADARSNLGLGNMAVQNKTAVDITGGSIAGITDLAVADGGTGASNAAQARTNLGLATVANTGSYNDLTNKPSIPSTLDDLSDVSLSSATLSVNDVLLYNGSAWIADTIVLTTAEITSAFGDTVLLSADIGVTIQGYDPNILVSGDIGVLVQGYDPDILVSSDIGVTIQGYDASILKSADIGVKVQAYDPDILTSADIGVTIQPYDANILVSSDIGVTIQPYDATILNAADIGSSVQAYDSNLTSFVSVFTLPTADGTANQILKTDGAGNLGFASAAAAGVSSFNTRTGAITLTSGDVTTALGYTPLGSGNIGVSVQAYDSNLTSFVGTFTLPTADGSNAQVLTTNGAGTLTFASASTVGALNDLSDVTITSPSASQILRYDASATQWINVALPSYLPVTKYDTTTVQISVANGYVPVLNRAGGTVNISVV